MKKLILQHWSGPMNELTELSVKNISRYAELVGADHTLLRGHVFRENLSAPCQKVHMLDQAYDEYDVVVMLDPDMFVRKGMTENIFDPNITGVGMHTTYQSMIFGGLQQMHPKLADASYAYWGGAIYKMDRELRQRMRANIREEEIVQFSGSGRYEDEGIMHRLAVLAKVTPCSLPGGNKWCCGNFEPEVKNAALIHIRHKVLDSNGKFVLTPKIEVYKGLVKRGLIEE